MTSSDLPRVKNSRNFRFALQPCSYRTKVQAHRCLIYKVQSAVLRLFLNFSAHQLSLTAYLVYRSMRLMSTLFFNFFQKKFYRKFVHSIYTYIIYSSCSNVLKIKHHLPLYTDNRGNNTAHHLSEDISIFDCNLYHILLTFIPYF